MSRTLSPLRAALLVVALLGLVVAVALPALAVGPSAAPGASAGAAKEPRGPKASKEPEVAVTLRGVVARATDAEGTVTYTLTVDGKTVRLDAGPPWFFGDQHPLAPFVGKTVTVTGGQRGDEVDVETVDGTRLRAEGRPPWAGGWKAVGSAHPGWSQEKWDRWQQHQADKHGAAGAAGAGCWPPGHCKPRGSGAPAGAETPDPNGG
jgi:hypothetical protein